MISSLLENWRDKNLVVDGEVYPVCAMCRASFMFCHQGYTNRDIKIVQNADGQEIIELIEFNLTIFTHSNLISQTGRNKLEQVVYEGV